MLNALTIDLEDWYHPELVRHRVPESDASARTTLDQPQALIDTSTRALLDMLQERGIKATFFVLGEIAQRHPHLIQDIGARGHELCCHGMTHRPLWELTPDEFRRDLAQFGIIMSSVVPHVDVVGFRAPTFSLDNRTGWALPILAESGYLYDSSIFPVRNPVYGVGNCPLGPYRPSADDIAKEDRSGHLVEFPMSVWTLAGLRFPVCGGFYLRALPFGFIQSSLRQIQRRRPFVIYIHPWEIDAGTPRLALPPLSRFVTYHNLGSMMRRLTSLLEAFHFAPMRTVLEEMGELG